jgi:hypothetical protein
MRFRFFFFCFRWWQQVRPPRSFSYQQSCLPVYRLVQNVTANNLFTSDLIQDFRFGSLLILDSL